MFYILLLRNVSKIMFEICTFASTISAYSHGACLKFRISMIFILNPKNVSIYLFLCLIWHLISLFVQTQVSTVPTKLCRLYCVGVPEPGAPDVQSGGGTQRGHRLPHHLHRRHRPAPAQAGSHVAFSLPNNPIIFLLN
jgi:hypothetical protein